MFAVCYFNVQIFHLPKVYEINLPFFLLLKKATCVRDLSSFTVFASDTILVVKCFIYIYIYVFLACSAANWKDMWMKQYVADSSLLPKKDVWFLQEGKFAQWILEGLKYWCVYLLFCPNAIFSTLWRLFWHLIFECYWVFIFIFFLLIIHFDISL